MAKQNVQDFRIDFIETISRTENLKVLKSISSVMRETVFSCTMSDKDRKIYIEDALEKIKGYMGESVKSFLPLQKISKIGYNTYFEKIRKGYDEIKARKVDEKAEERSVKILEGKIEKYREKGKFDKLQDYELELSVYQTPLEAISKLQFYLESLNISMEQGEIDIPFYSKKSKKYIKLLKLAEKKRDVLTGAKKKSENIDLVVEIEQGLRTFLCNLFFDERSSISNSPIQYLCTFDGDLCIDFEHVLLLYSYLEKKGYQQLDLVKGVLYYLALERFYCDVVPISMNFGLVSKKGIFLQDNSTEFYCNNMRGYMHAYIPSLITPRGYRGYVFEPSNLAQQSFIAAINKEKLTYDKMVNQYKEAQLEMKSMEHGIFYTFLDKDVENRLMPDLINDSFPLSSMDGIYRKALWSEFKDRRENFGNGDSSEVMTNMYSRVVTPYALEVLGSYIRTFCQGLSQLEDKKRMFFYYVSPQRVALAVKEDVTEEEMQAVFPQVFLNNLKETRIPSIDEIVQGICF